MSEWGREGELPSDKKMAALTEILGGVLGYVHHELAEQEIIDGGSFFAATLVVKMETSRGGTPFAAVVSLPDLPVVTISLLQEALMHVQNVARTEGDTNGKG